jgi:hypothetical protein
MLVELATNVSPASIAQIASTSPSVGQTAAIAGYGLNEHGTAGEKLYVGTSVVAVGGEVPDYSEPDAEMCAGYADATVGPCSGGPLLITVDSGADGGACTGDSGGPLFVRDASPPPHAAPTWYEPAQAAETKWKTVSGRRSARDRQKRAWCGRRHGDVGLVLARRQLPSWSCGSKPISRDFNGDHRSDVALVDGGHP